jgi:uncharacterized protein
VRSPKILRGFTAVDAAILVFARAPLAGRAKTRLATRLGEAGAARLQARLTARTLRTARDAGFAVVELHATPSRTHRLLAFYGRRFQVEVKNQKGGDLGERMHNALARALRRHRAVILIGTDCPALTPRDLRRAARLLRGSCDAVVAPAEDGGYVLIAMRRVSTEIFSGIHWGSSAVYADTAERLSAAGYRWRALRTLWDVDRPEDLDRLGPLGLAGTVRARRSS